MLTKVFNHLLQFSDTCLSLQDMLRTVCLTVLSLSYVSAFAPGALPTQLCRSQRLALSANRGMPLGLRMEDNSFLKSAPKPKSLKSVGLSDDARAKVRDPLGMLFN